MPIIDLSQVPDTQERKAFLLSQYGTGLQRYRLTHKIPETPPDSPLFEHVVTVPDEDHKRKPESGLANSAESDQSQPNIASQTPPGFSAHSTIASGLGDDERNAAIRQMQVSALQAANAHEWSGTLKPEQSTDPSGDIPETPTSHEPQLSFDEVRLLLAELQSEGLKELAALNKPPLPTKKIQGLGDIRRPIRQGSTIGEHGWIAAGTRGMAHQYQPAGTAALSSIAPSDVQYLDVTLILSKPTPPPGFEDMSSPQFQGGPISSESPVVEQTPQESTDPSRNLPFGSPAAELVNPYEISTPSATTTGDFERTWPTFDLESEAFRDKRHGLAKGPKMPADSHQYFSNVPTEETKSVFRSHHAALALLFTYLILTLCLRAIKYNRRRRSVAWRKDFGHRNREDDKLA